MTFLLRENFVKVQKNVNIFNIDLSGSMMIAVEGLNQKVIQEDSKGNRIKRDKNSLDFVKEAIQ